MKETDLTICQVFWKRVEENREKPLFIYHKKGDFPPYTQRGKIRTMSWNEVADLVKKIGIGLLALGAKRGERISIMSNTRWEWVVADLALLSIGGETGSIYPNNLPEHAVYIINELKSEFVFVEQKWQRDSLLKLRNQMPQLKKIITIDCDAGYDPLCMTFEQLIQLGTESEKKYSVSFDYAVKAGKLSDVASYIYTSGTTGIPKGAVHTHESLMYTIYTGSSWLPIEAGMIDLSFLPMAHVFEQFAGALLDIYRGDVTVAFARSIDTVAKDFGHVKPHFCRTAPRFFEKVYSTVWSKVEALAHLTAETFADALAASKRVVIDGDLYGAEKNPDDIKWHHDLDEHNFKEVRDLALGGNMKFFVSGGAPLSKEINEFFWAMGMPIYELYGMTEAGGMITNRPGCVKIGSVGKPWPSFKWPGGKTEIKLSSEGEIMVKGPNVMKEYYNKPEDTAEAFQDGWLKSGDIAEVDKDGFYWITDRIKNIIMTSSGKNVAPVRIETVFMEDPLIGQVIVYGDRRKYLTALITLDPEGLAAKANELGLKGSYSELTQSEEIKKFVEEIVAEKNKLLAKYERINGFVILDRVLTIENGEITPTMKVKRKEVFKKYGEILEKLYEQ